MMVDWTAYFKGADHKDNMVPLSATGHPSGGRAARERSANWDRRFKTSFMCLGYSIKLQEYLF